MKVAFVGVGSEQLAVSLLSAVLRREGHTTTLAFNPALFDYDGFVDLPPLAALLDRTRDVVEQVVADRPDLVAFSVLTPAYQWSLRVAEAIKARIDVPVIFGGVHPSAVPDVCLENDCVDFVCVGEGEAALVELCEELGGGRRRPRAPIPNLAWRDGDRTVRGEPAPFIQDLDALPYFEKEIWDGHIRIADTWMTMSSRGCPYRCTFCFNNFFAKLPGKGAGRYLRQRSIDHMMGELVEAKQRWGIRRVDFEDDIFTTHKDWIRDFLKEYRREIDVPFQCLVHPRFVDDDIARWLKDAGCQHVQMGIQSVDEEYKRAQLLRMEKDSHLRTALKALDAASLDLKADHILGLPGEPLRAQEMARELYAEYTPRRIQTFWLVHLPGVELTTGAVERGELDESEYESITRGASGRYHSENQMAEGARFRRYELLFRLMPLLPRSLRSRIRVSHLPELPSTLNHFAGMTLEVGNALKNRDAETYNYVRFHLHHLRRLVPKVIGELLRQASGRESKPFRDRVTAPITESAKGPAGAMGVRGAVRPADPAADVIAVPDPSFPGDASSGSAGAPGCGAHDDAPTAVGVEITSSPRSTS